MAGRTITQRIALDGGEQIRAQLEAIGKAGQDAFKKFQDAGGANAVIQRFGSTLDALKAKAQAMGEAGRRLGQDFNNLGSSVTSSARRIGLIGTAITGAVVGFGALVKGAGEAADKLSEAAESIGITTRELENLQGSAQQFGISGEKLVKSLTLLNKSMDEQGKRTDDLAKKRRDLSDNFARGKLSMEAYLEQSTKLTEDAAEQSDAYTRLGISVRNADGTMRSTKEVLLEVADAFKGMPNGAQKAGIALELFSRDGARMIPFLNQGRKGIEALNKEAERVAPSLSELEKAVGGRLDDAFSRMKSSADSAVRSMRLLFAPAMTNLVEGVTEAIVANRSRLMDFAAAIADRVRPVVNDLIALMEGRDGDVKTSFVIQARDGVIALGEAVKFVVGSVIIPAFKGLMAILQVVAGAFNGIFGTNVTGGQIAFTIALAKIIGLFAVFAASIKVVVGGVALLVATFGGLPVILAAIGVAFGLFILKSVGGLKGIQDAWNAAWAAIAGAVTGTLDSIGSTLSALMSKIAGALQAVASGIANAFKFAWEAISTTAEQVFTNVVTFFTHLPEALGAIFLAVVKVATDAWNAIVAKALEIGQGIVTGFQVSIDAVTGFFRSLYDNVVAIFDKIVTAAQKVGSVIRKAMGGSNAAPAAASGGEVRAASGGHIRGRGTGTSDSIAAWLSNGEFVQQTKAVRKYGVDLMNALNQGRLPVDAVRSLMRGFNTGGLVESMGSLMPRQSSMSGLALAGARGGSSGRPVVLNFPGLSVPVTANESVIDRLLRHTTRTQIRSGGRKPSWYQG